MDLFNKTPHLCGGKTISESPHFHFSYKYHLEIMATKKQPAKTSKTVETAVPVATPVTKTATTTKTATPVAANKAASPAKIATPASPKTASPAKTAAPAAKAVKATAPANAAKADAPVAKKAVAKTEVPAVNTSKVTFVLPKEAVENAETVAVLGDFNNWQGGIVLTKQKDGSFKAAVELEKGRSYEYRFLINGEKWENDWAAEAYAPTPFGAYNSVVTA